MGDDGNLRVVIISLNGNRVFEVIVCFLGSIEASDGMLSHTCGTFTSCRDVLYKPNHSFITLRIKLSIVTCLKLQEFTLTVLSGVRRDLRLDAVLEVGQEAHTILQFYFKGLIVNWRPGTSNLLLTFFATWAELSFSSIIVHDADFPVVFLSKSPWVLF